MGFRVEIDEDKCTGDEECVNVCPVGVFEMKEGKATVANEDECLGCESCIEVCPSGALTVTEV
jgi:NAD-dependent dihydropyrimidine dehydrogenase PreA subunit